MLIILCLVIQENGDVEWEKDLESWFTPKIRHTRGNGSETRDMGGEECPTLMAATMRWYNTTYNYHTTNTLKKFTHFSFISGWVDLRGEGGPGHHPLLQREHLRGRVARGQETGPGQVHSHCPGLPTGLCLTGKLGLLTVCINRKDGGTQISSNALSVQRSMLTPQQLAFLLLVFKIFNVFWRNKNPKYLTQKWNENCFWDMNWHLFRYI